MTTISETTQMGRMGKRRWLVCGLLFTAVVINYIDRQMLGVLKPFMQKDLGWTETNYADIVFYFQGAYALSYLVFGAFVDRVGAKIGYATAFVIWQIAHIAHAGASSLTSFFAVRIGLGIGEGGNFPAAIRAIADWFPRKERALATGIFNAGSNIGAVVTPLVAPIIMTLWGWQMAFVITGVIGLLWVVAWLIFYRHPSQDPKLGAAERAWIEQDPADPEKKASWGAVFGKKQTWAYAIARFLVDPVWWMLLFWLPDFFQKTFHLGAGAAYSIVLAAVYLISDVGSVAGGWLSSRFLQMGWSVNRARKTALIILAFCALPYLLITRVDNNLVLATIVVGWVAAVHQAFSANLYTVASDIFPRRAVGTVIGIGGMLGGIGGMIMAKGVGKALSTTLGYPAIFAVCAFVYLLAILVLHVLSPRMETAEV